MSKCPFCESTNNEFLGESNICRSYKKVTNDNNLTATKSGTYVHPIIKSLCLDCGYVFESMSKENLMSFLEEKKYFK